MAGDGIIKKVYTATKAHIEEKNNLNSKVKDTNEKRQKSLNSIMSDGKVTYKEALVLGLNQEYDVSTQEGKETFLLAYEKVEERKLALNQPIDANPPKFGLEE